MIKVYETDNELTLRDFPVYMWFAGLVIAGLGVYLIVVCFGALEVVSKYPIQIVLLFLFLFGLVGFGSYFLGRSPITTSRIDQNTETVTVEKRSLFKHQSWRFGFDDVGQNLDVKTSFLRNTRYILYTPEFRRKDGETIEIMDYGFSKEGQAYNIVDLANKYMQKKGEREAFKLTILNDDSPI